MSSPSSKLVDFHCHLDLYPDYERALRVTEDAKVYTLTVTTTPKAWPRNSALVSGSRYVRAALGLHPQLVKDRSEEIILWEKYLGETRYIGEVGLDSSPQYYNSIELQIKIFSRILQACAEAGDKVLTIHSVRSATKVLELIEKKFPQDRGKAVLHWFTGSKSEAKKAIELGCYFSVNFNMLNSARGQEIISMLPADRILTETDGPFTKIHNTIAYPAEIMHTVKALAVARKTTFEDQRDSIYRNLNSLLTQ